MPGVSWSANCLAASCAAASRLGATSVARIDCDTSITSITTARLRGIRTSLVGPAIATVNSISDSTSRIAEQVPPAGGPLGRDALQQFHVGEAQHPLLPGRLHDDVQADQRRAPRAGTGRTTDVRSPTGSSARATVKSCATCHFSVSGLSLIRHSSVLSTLRASAHRRRRAPRRRLATNLTTSAIQSRSVRSVSSGASQRRNVRATSARWAAAALAKSSRSCASMVNSRVTPDLGVLQDDVADVGQFDVARVDDLDAEHLVPPGDGSQRPHPVDRAQEVADDHRHAAPPLGTAQRVDGRRQVAAHADGRLRRGGDGAQQLLLVHATGQCGHPPRRRHRW